MLQNHFTNDPSLGNNNDSSKNFDDLEARIRNLEQEFDKVDTKINKEKTEEPRQEERPSKVKWGKLRKFFKEVVVPILNFIPRFINAVSNYKAAAHA